MLSKTVSPATMYYFTVVFVVLFKISLGFHLDFGLSHLFDGLTGGHPHFFHTGSLHESPSFQQETTPKPDTSTRSTFAVDASGTFGDSLKAVSDRATAALQTVAKVSKDSWEAVAERASEAEIVFDDTLEKVAENAGSVLDGSVLKDPLETVSALGGSLAGKARSGVLDSTLKGLSENIGKSLDGSALKDSVGRVSGNADKFLDVRILADPLKSISEQAERTKESSVVDDFVNISDASVLLDSLQSFSKKAGKAVQRGMREGSFETDSASKSLGSGILGSSIESLSETVDTRLDESDLKSTVETISDKADRFFDVDILADSLKSPSERTGQTIKNSELDDFINGSDASILGDLFIDGSDANILGDLLINDSDTSNLGDSLEIVSGKAEESFKSILRDPLKTLSKQAGKAVQSGSSTSEVEGSLKPGGKVTKALRGGILGDSLKISPEKESGTLTASSLKDALGRISLKGTGILKDTLENATGKTDETLHEFDLDSLEVVSKNSGKKTQGSIFEAYLGAFADNANKNLNGGNFEDTMEIIAEKARTSLSGDIAAISGRLKGTLTDGIQEAGNINLDSSVDPMRGLFPDLAKGMNCIAKSAASFESVSAVSTFVSTFHKGIHSSKVLTILFNITDATPHQFSQFKYRYLADIFRKLGFLDYKEMATFAVRHITRHFYHLNMHVLKKVYSSLFADYLFAEEILTDDNAEHLAKVYLKSMKESAEANKVDEDCSYNSKFQATGDAKSSFLFSFGKMSLQQAWEFVFYYAHAWLLAAVDYGSIKSINMEK